MHLVFKCTKCFPRSNVIIKAINWFFSNVKKVNCFLEIFHAYELGIFSKCFSQCPSGTIVLNKTLLQKTRSKQPWFVKLFRWHIVSVKVPQKLALLRILLKLLTLLCLNKKIGKLGKKFTISSNFKYKLSVNLFFLWCSYISSLLERLLCKESKIGIVANMISCWHFLIREVMSKEVVLGNKYIWLRWHSFHISQNLLLSSWSVPSDDSCSGSTYCQGDKLSWETQIKL